MVLQKAYVAALIATFTLVQAQIPGYCTSDSDCSSLTCSGGDKKATCQAVGMGQSSGQVSFPRQEGSELLQNKC